MENNGGGWGIIDWSADDSKLLVQERISVNESRLYSIDANTGNKTRLLPEKDERTTFLGISFTTDDKGIYLITNKDSEFNRLAYYDLSTGKLSYISSAIPWDVETAVSAGSGQRFD